MIPLIADTLVKPGTTTTEIRVDTAQPLSTDLVGLITDACDRAEDTEGTPVVVLHLTDGGVRSQWPGKVGVHLVGKWEQALRRLERLRGCTVAVAEGHCGPAALELLLTADHRIAGADLALDVSGWPGMGLYRLVHQVGLAQARRLLRHDGDLSAADLLACGVVDETTGDTAGRVEQVADRARLEDAAGHAVRRQLLLEASSVAYEEALGSHLAACDRELRRNPEADCD
ncbi:enoyl-CoA hydratase/isomerase family protein (plasmid) [Streptomyces sp. NBC_01340]|uniref:enoyl-CoA-hydratase DpgB n=1 Tax=Streptomyces sp. NBC_01340 TaxID=2903830 RepID=UPI002E163135|nr:enoyl-CoA hydratase/isomerase family protein [Streptomyces sp. NBC_01340]